MVLSVDVQIAIQTAEEAVDKAVQAALSSSIEGCRALAAAAVRCCDDATAAFNHEVENLRTIRWETCAITSSASDSLNPSILTSQYQLRLLQVV